MNLDFLKMLLLCSIVFVVSCEDKECVLKQSYEMTTFNAAVELFALDGDIFERFDDKSLEGRYNGANFLDEGFQDSMFHTSFSFSLVEFENDSLCTLSEWTTKKKYELTYGVIDDFIVVEHSKYGWNFVFRFDDDCHLENCNFLIATLRNSVLEIKPWFVTDCLNSTHADAASEFKMEFGGAVPDTIGVFQVTNRKRF